MNPKIRVLALLLMAFAFSLQAQEETPDNKHWTVIGNNKLLFNQVAFSNWAGGGINSMAGSILLDYQFNYKKGKHVWDNAVKYGYGMNYQKNRLDAWRKTDDIFEFLSAYGYELGGNWYFSMELLLRSQFVPGYSYEPFEGQETKTLISDFFAPAYLTYGPGILFKPSEQFKINLSPVSVRNIFVLNDALSQMGAFGVDPGEKTRWEFGANLQVYYKVETLNNVFIEQILNLYSNYLENPQNVDLAYQLNIDFKVNSYISANFGLHLIYDDNTELVVDVIDDGSGGSINVMGKRLQVKQLFGLGITVTLPDK